MYRIINLLIFLNEIQPDIYIKFGKDTINTIEHIWHTDNENTLSAKLPINNQTKTIIYFLQTAKSKETFYGYAKKYKVAHDKFVAIYHKHLQRFIHYRCDFFRVFCPHVCFFFLSFFHFFSYSKWFFNQKWLFPTEIDFNVDFFNFSTFSLSFSLFSHLSTINPCVNQSNRNGVDCIKMLMATMSEIFVTFETVKRC